MKTLLALVATLLLQMASVSAGPVAEPQHLRYERMVELPGDASGQACVTLDSTVFAHAATESLNDLRLYAKNSTVEAPFTLTESEPQHPEDESAQVRNVAGGKGEVSFDIVMPPRPYTAVVLDLAAKNFFATAHVSGAEGIGKRTELGSFELFDLSAQHLSRSTTLPLQESTFSELHVELHLTPAPGSRGSDFGPAIVKAASVPPSREAQTLYTTVAETDSISQRGHETLAKIAIPAHVPVERASFVLDPGFDRNFAREVRITATPRAARDRESIETIEGEISRVKLPGTQFGAPIDSREMSVDAVLGANLRSSAMVELAVADGEKPLPLRSVRLEMRQRRICFDAAASEAPYTLRYGDAILHASLYDYARRFVPAAKPLVATLGAERVNPGFVARVDRRPYIERHPELVWVVLLAGIAVLGSFALRSTRRHSQSRWEEK
ncbi:hypothetical protein [Granulicella mallensis]|uniref:DUF3999 domain-containing protein n=1 Tax=Granulicella mallensis (strain ATCC BAA-1857 / DSM 23137 / MP5ACTX8) TaxID=682795 RepID=G8NST3_GRAMM|nr:hypothetical protein [Granulicella mallensis]AEU35182.1 hypothetical protein AciX8_0833 [Granulicella mallensis MP5ACTX8]